MKKYYPLKELTLLGLAILLAVCTLPGCGGNSTPIGPGESDNEYQYIGSIIKDLNLDIFVMVADLKRNDTVVTDAVIYATNDTLIYNGSYYTRTFSSSNHYGSGTLKSIFKDSSLFSDTITSVIPANLVITSVLPSIKDPSDLVNVQWTGSAGVDGYIIAAVKRDSSYLKMGYSQYVTSLSPLETIENEAFTINSISGGEPNPGTYDIFVYAYWGVPDSIMTSALLPVPIPGQLDENINEQNLSGSVGVIVVSQAGSVEVIAE